MIWNIDYYVIYSTILIITVHKLGIALQSTVENLANVYEKYYKKTDSKPKFKSKKNEIKSYTMKLVKAKDNVNIEIIGKKIKLPKLGLVKIENSKDVDGNIKRVTVSRTQLVNILYLFFVM